MITHTALPESRTLPVAAPLASPSEEVVLLRAQNQQLAEQLASLQQRVAWFEKQLFGQKSEKWLIENPHQASLLGEAPTGTPPPEAPKLSITYERGKAPKRRDEDCVTDSGLRFGEEVPRQVIEIWPEEVKGLSEGTGLRDHRP